MAIKEIGAALDRVARNTINDNFKSQDGRIDNLVLQAGDAHPELQDAHYSGVKGQTFATVGKRFDAVEQQAITDKTAANSELQAGLALKRDKSVMLTQADMSTASEAHKLTMNHLSQEVKNAMTGTAPVSPNIADGQVTEQKVANNAISYNKLNVTLQKNLQFVGKARLLPSTGQRAMFDYDSTTKALKYLANSEKGAVFTYYTAKGQFTVTLPSEEVVIPMTTASSVRRIFWNLETQNFVVLGFNEQLTFEGVELLEFRTSPFFTESRLISLNGNEDANRITEEVLKIEKPILFDKSALKISIPTMMIETNMRQYNKGGKDIVLSEDGIYYICIVPVGSVLDWVASKSKTGTVVDVIDTTNVRGASTFKRVYCQDEPATQTPVTYSTWGDFLDFKSGKWRLGNGSYGFSNPNGGHAKVDGLIHGHKWWTVTNISRMTPLSVDDSSPLISSAIKVHKDDGVVGFTSLSEFGNDYTVQVRGYKADGSIDTIQDFGWFKVNELKTCMFRTDLFEDADFVLLVGWVKNDELVNATDVPWRGAVVKPIYKSDATTKQIGSAPMIVVDTEATYTTSASFPTRDFGKGVKSFLVELDAKVDVGSAIVHFGGSTAFDLKVTNTNYKQFSYKCAVRSSDNQTLLPKITVPTGTKLTIRNFRITPIYDNAIHLDHLSAQTYAHRGLSMLYPENTIQSMEEAFKRGCSIVELDLFTSTDNKAMFIHDNTIGRTCEDVNTNQNSNTLSEAEYLAYRWGNGFTGLSLETAVKIAKIYNGALLFDVRELKEACFKGQVKEVLDRYNYWDKIYFMAGSVSTLNTWAGWAKSIDRKINVTLLGWSMTSGTIDSFVGMLNTDAVILKDIAVSNDAITTDLCNYAHSKNMRVMTFTVNSLQRTQELFDLGVDILGGDIIVDDNMMI